MPSPRAHRLSRLISAAAAGPLPWLRPSSSARLRRVVPNPDTKSLTNASVLKSVTANLNDPNLLLSIYTSAAKTPGFRHDYATYKALLPALASHRRSRAVDLLLCRMRRHSLPTGPSLLLPLIEVYVALALPSRAADLALSVIPIHDKVFSVLVSRLLTGNHIELARSLFSEEILSKLGFSIKVRHYVGVLKAYCENGDARPVFELLDSMAERGSVPDVFCYGSLVSKLCKNGFLDEGFQLVEQMKRRGREPDVVIWNTLVYGCVRKGEIDRALRLVERMEEMGIHRDVGTYNTLISGICEHQSVRDGIKFFLSMLEKGVPADVITFTTIFFGLHKEAALVEIGILSGRMVRMGITPDAACWRILCKWVLCET